MHDWGMNKWNWNKCHIRIMCLIFCTSSPAHRQRPAGSPLNVNKKKKNKKIIWHSTSRKNYPRISQLFMKKFWRNLVSFVSRNEIDKWGGITTIILLVFATRDLVTARYLLSKYGRERIDKFGGKNNHDGEADIRNKFVETNKKGLQVSSQKDENERSLLLFKAILSFSEKMITFCLLCFKQ